ncbi:MAG: hypothetical protein JOZ07_04760 [Solirubrobacterales bacterium]|nr:hypothetical protein [Solirubrobacterales bacterium]
MDRVARDPSAGLCAQCRHRQEVRNTRGSTFLLCRRSRAQPERYPKYPRLPVTRCEGFVPEPAATDHP